MEEKQKQKRKHNFQTSWDDGHTDDLKLRELLLKYNIPAIFYIPNNCKLSEDDIKKLSKDFEIGGHTRTHPNDLKTLTYTQLYNEIVDNKVWLEEIIGRKVTKFCYPSGRYNELVIETLKECGYKESRTVDVMCIEEPLNPFRKRTSIHVHPYRKEYKERNWFEVAINLYYESLEEGNGYFALWGHSWEITEYSLWKQLEELFKFINNNRYD